MNWMMNQPERIIQKIKMNVYLKKNLTKWHFCFSFFKKNQQQQHFSKVTTTFQ